MKEQPPEWIIYTIAVVAILANPLTVPNLPELLSDLGQPDSSSGLLISAIPLPGIIAAPAIGLLANRHGRRTTLLWCLVLFGTTGAASAVAQNFATLVLVRLAQGVGSAGLISLSVILIGDHWTGAARTRVLGRNAAAISIGLLVSPIVAGLLAGRTSWRWSIALSALALPIAGICALQLPKNEGSSISPGSLALQLAAVRAPGILPTLATAFVLAAVVFGVFNTIVPLHLAQEFQAGPEMRGLLLSLPAVAGAIAAVRLDWIRRHASVRQLLVGSTAVVALAVATVGAASSLIAIAVAAIVFGLASGISNPMLQDFAASTASSRQLPIVLAAWVSTMRLGQAAGPLTAGLLLDATSTTTSILIGALPLAALAVALTVAPINSPRQA